MNVRFFPEDFCDIRTKGIMLCKSWTCMIRANFFRNASVNFKKKTNKPFFNLNLMNTNIWIFQNFDYIKNFTIWKICWSFLYSFSFSLHHQQQWKIIRGMKRSSFFIKSNIISYYDMKKTWKKNLPENTHFFCTQ